MRYILGLFQFYVSSERGIPVPNGKVMLLRNLLRTRATGVVEDGSLWLWRPGRHSAMHRDVRLVVVLRAGMSLGHTPHGRFAAYWFSVSNCSVGESLCDVSCAPLESSWRSFLCSS